MSFSLTPEQRDAARAKAAAVRSARAAILADLKHGRVRVSEVLRHDADPIRDRIPARTLVRALHGVGRVKAERLMAELSIAPTRRVLGLGERQRAALVQRFG